MVSRVKATFNIDQEVMRQLREEAARRKTTVSALVEVGLRHVLAAPVSAEGSQLSLPPLPTRDSGGLLVNIDDREALYRAMGEE